jgi:hypothetical protein
MAFLVVEDERRVRSFLERGIAEEARRRACADAAGAERPRGGGIEMVLLD